MSSCNTCTRRRRAHTGVTAHVWYSYCVVQLPGTALVEVTQKNCVAQQALFLFATASLTPDGLFDPMYSGSLMCYKMHLQHLS